MDLLSQIKQLINMYYGDTSRSPKETKEGLEDLLDEIEIKIESLR